MSRTRATGSGEQARGASSEGDPVVVARHQLPAVAGGLFQVVADDLVGRAGPTPVSSLERVGKALVQRGSLRLRECRIGDVSNEDMVEAQALARHRPVNEPLPLERAEVGVQ